MIPLECHLPMLPCHRARVSPRGEAVLGSTAAYYPVSGLPLNFAAPNRQPLTANRSRLIFHRRRAGRSSGLPGLLEDGDVDLVFDLLGTGPDLGLLGDTVRRAEAAGHRRRIDAGGRITDERHDGSGSIDRALRNRYWRLAVGGWERQRDRRG